jgi:tRNA uridine 5-carboxymethylaminomethyl modification enzyme
MLREDNADLRLTEKGHELGLVNESRWRAFCEKREAIERAQAQLHDTWVRVGHNDALSSVLTTPLQHDCRAAELLKRPEIQYTHIQALADLNLPPLAAAVALQVEISSKYAGYIERQAEDILKLQKHEQTVLPDHLDYQRVTGLSNEVMQKLTQIRPVSLGQAGRIAGVTPAALSLLLVHLKKMRAIA